MVENKDVGDIATETIVANIATADIVAEAMQEEQSAKAKKKKIIMLKKKKLANTTIEDISEVEKISKMTDKEQKEDLDNKLDKIMEEDGKEKIKKITEERTLREETKTSGSPIEFLGKEISPSTTTLVTTRQIETNVIEINVSFRVKTNVMKEENIVDEVQNVLLYSAPEIATRLKEAITVQDGLIASTRQK